MLINPLIMTHFMSSTYLKEKKKKTKSKILNLSIYVGHVERITATEMENERHFKKSI